MENYIEVTESELIEIFTEWDRQKRERPEDFTDSFEDEEYGIKATKLFLKLFNEIKE